MTDKIKRNPVLTWFCVAVIAVVTYFVFSPSLNDGFTNWDDQAYVMDNPLVVTNSIPVIKIFETPVNANYHPLTILSYALDYRYGKLDPFGYHLENVILHVLNTILVFFFIFFLTRRNLLMAVIVSLFFGIHPMHVESVTWISERKDVLYVFFFMAGSITYLRYSDTRKTRWYIFTFVLFILSCLSKGMAVVFPVVLLLIDYLRGVKWERRSLIEKIPFFLLAIVFGITAVKVQQTAVVTLKTISVFQRLLFASYNAILYIVKFFIPFKLSAFYPYPVANSSITVRIILFLAPFLLLGIIAALIYFFIKREKELAFGLLFYFVTIVPVLQFISIGSAIMADRYSYLNCIGLLFAAAYLINKTWSRPSRKTLLKYPLIIIAIIGAVTFSSQTYSRTKVWKDSETLWTNVIDNYPGVATAYFERGNYYKVNNEMNKALTDYNKAIELDSAYADVYIDRGALYSETGRTNLALTDFTKAIELAPNNPIAYNNRGIFYARCNYNDLALADLTKAIELDSTYETAYVARACVYRTAGKTNSALADFSYAIALNPADTLAYINRGLLYLNTGKLDMAMADFTKTIAISPNNSDAYNDRGLTYYRYGKYDTAMIYYNKAIALNPSSSSAHYNRGLCYRTIHQYENALSDFTSGIQLNPENIETYYYMRGMCNIDLRNYNDAIADFSKAIEKNPSVPDIWFNRSISESKIGQNDNAKADALKAQQLQGK